MLTGSDRDESRRDSVVFVICLALSIVALMLPGPWRDPVAGALRQTVLLPLLRLQEEAQRLESLVEGLDVIVAGRDSAIREAQFVPLLRAENARLRALLGMQPRLPTTFVSAEVLHHPQATEALTLLLSVGGRRGVTPLAPVVTAEGLVGIVSAVDRRTSVAITWAHPDFGASAMTADGELFGIVAPTQAGRLGGELLELTGVPYRDVVPAGTLVVTSGLGGVLPRGLPLGSVLGVSREQRGWERSYFVRPAVHPSDVSHVLVLLGPERDLTGAYADTTSPPPPSVP